MDCTALSSLRPSTTQRHRSGEQRTPPKGMLVQLRLSAGSGPPTPTPQSCSQLGYQLPLPQAALSDLREMGWNCLSLKGMLSVPSPFLGSCFTPCGSSPRAAAITPLTERK